MLYQDITTKIIKERIIYAVILINPIIEIIYSTLYRLNINLPINQFFRLCGFVIFLGFVKEVRTKKIVAALAGIYVLIWIIQITARFSTISFDDFVFIVKIIYSTSLIFIFRDFIKCKTVNLETLVKVTVLSTFIIIASICISPLGLGFEAWTGNEYRTGYVGLFLFGNYLTVVLLIAFCLLFFSKAIKHKIIIACFLVLTIILLGNKAGLIGAFIYASVLWLFYIFNEPKGKKKSIFILASCIILVLLLPAAGIYISKFIQNQIELYKAYGYNNIMSFLLSNRDLQINCIRSYIDNNNYNTFLGNIVGYGYTNINAAMKSQYLWMNFIEMDFYALRYYLGYLSAIIWAGIDIKLMYVSVKNAITTKKIQNICISTGILIAIVHSFLTGHVIFESLTVMYFAILGAIVLSSGDEQEKNRVKNNNMKKIKLHYIHPDNYGNLMLTAAFIDYIHSKYNVGDIIFYTDVLNDADLKRVKESLSSDVNVEREHLYDKEQRGIFGKIKKLIKLPTEIKYARNNYDLYVVLGGDCISQYYSKQVFISDLIKFKFISNKINVYCLGQTIGPFNGWGRILTNICLKKAYIYTRDDDCYDYIMSNLKLKRVYKSADLAFLDIPFQNDAEKILQLREKYCLGDNYVTIVPSGAVHQYTENRENYILQYVSVIESLIEAGYQILLLAHVIHTDDSNDSYVIRDIKKKVAPCYLEKICIIDYLIMPYEARILLGGGKFTITGRMHAAVSSINQGVLPICLSYSVKYRGVIGRDFKLDKYIIECRGDEKWQEKQISEKIKETILCFEKNREKDTERTCMLLKEIQNKAQIQLDEILSKLYTPIKE